MLVTITQSGETADTLAAQREAKGKGAKTLTICDVIASPARARLIRFCTRVRGWRSAWYPPGLFAQLAALSLLGIALGAKKGKLKT